jgi:cellulose synthase/poly-beta-1,6-N-acetylglucosamine synthase-like glycosyltransferase
MTSIVIALLVYVATWTVVRTLLVTSVLDNMRDVLPVSAAASFSPKSSIVLCLRGADPLLEDCLAALCQQDYPDYEVQIVVDHPDDPAWEIATQFLAQRSSQVPVKLSLLEHKSPQRSLKCSSILQVVNQLDPDCEVLAFIDADVVPHPTWLRELVSPLENPEVGATCGNRWYLPEDMQLGSLVRHVWNYSAIILMLLLHIPWGGTLAIKTKAIREAGLLQLWERSLVEDAVIYKPLLLQGLQVKFVPSLLMVNRESCGFLSFQQWSQRQALFVRLYGPLWPFMFGYSAIYVIFYIVSSVVLGLACFSQQWLVVAALLAIQVADLVVVFWQSKLIRKTVHRILLKRGEKVPTLGFWDEVRFFFLIPLLVLSCTRVLLAQRLKHVQWRGVIYDFKGGWQVKMRDYQPYQPAPSSSDSMASL